MPTNPKLVRLIVFLVLSYQHLAAQDVNGSSYAYLLKGNYYLDNGNPIAAVENYNRCLTLNPTSIEALLESANLYMQAGTLEEAYNRYSAAANLNLEALEYADLLAFIEVMVRLDKTKELRKWVSYANLLADSAGQAYEDSVFYVVTDYQNAESRKHSDLNVIEQKRLVLSQSKVREILSDKLEIQSVSLASDVNQLYFTATDNPTEASNQVYRVNYPVTDKNPVIDEVDLNMGKLEIQELSVASDARMIVFSAADPNSNRGYDLYRSSFDGKKWTRPEKLALTINSEFDECNPHLTNVKHLYFASNRDTGLGGFDIYRADLGNPSSKPVLLNTSINSEEDERQFVMDSSESRGFLVRAPSKKTKDDQVFDVNRYSLKLTRDSYKNQSSFNSDGGFTVWTSSGSSAKLFENETYFFFNFTPGVDYTLITEHDRYFEDKTIFSSSTQLTHKNFYTFHIKNSSGLYSESSKEDNLTQNDLEFVHIEPGDLITFQLLPHPKSVKKPGKTKLQAFRESTYISISDTIVFSYIVEADPSVSGPSTSDLSLAALSSDTTDAVISNKELKAVIAPPTIQVGQLGAIVNEPDVELNFDPNREFSLATVDKEYSQERQSKPQKRPKSTAIATEEVAEESYSESRSAVSERSVATPPEEALAGIDQAATAGLLDSQKTATIDTKLEKQQNQAENPQQDMLVVPNEQEISKSPEDPKENKDPEEVERREVLSSPTNELIINTSASLVIESEKATSSLDVKQDRSSEDLIDLSPEKADLKVAVQTTQKSTKNDLSENTEKKAIIEQASPSEEMSAPIFPVLFRVQIAAAKSQLTEEQKNRIYSGDRQVTSLQIDGYYKYFVVETPDYEEAKLALRSAQVSGAFISAYRGLKRVSLQDGIRVNQEVEIAAANPTLPAENQSIKKVDENKNNKDIPVIDVAESRIAAPQEIKAVKQESPVLEASREPSPIEFRVQVAASKTRMTDSQLERIYSGPLSVRYFTESDYYKYYIAATKTFSEAKKILNACGVQGAFISAYKNGTKWKLSDAIRSE